MELIAVYFSVCSGLVALANLLEPGTLKRLEIWVPLPLVKSSPFLFVHLSCPMWGKHLKPIMNSR